MQTIDTIQELFKCTHKKIMYSINDVTEKQV